MTCSWRPSRVAGATHWPVYLPEGAWYDFWTHQAHHGPCAITVAAPLDRLPLFVRAGAILPLGPVKQFDGDVVDDELTLLVFPAAQGATELYDDDGASTGYRDGGYALTAITMTQEDGRLTVDIAAPRSDPGMVPRSRRYSLQIHTTLTPRSALVVSASAPQHCPSALGMVGRTTAALFACR